jgi:hypothetical protein
MSHFTTYIVHLYYMNNITDKGSEACLVFLMKRSFEKRVFNITDVSKLLLFPLCIAARRLAIMYMIL